ncbi:unnamed protein product [Cunninghamella blakesleeana]
MSNIIKTPHRTTTTDPKFLNTPYSSFDKLTLNSNTTNNGRIKIVNTNEKPSNLNARLNIIKRVKEDKDTDHPNTFMVFKDKKITFVDSPMNNEKESVFGSDDDNDISEDDETNSFSPGRLSVSPDRGFPSQNLFSDDDEELVDKRPIERMIDDDVFGSSPINKKQQHKEANKKDDIFDSVPIRGKGLFKDDFFSSTSMSKTQYKKDSHLDHSSSWLDDIYVPPKQSKNKKSKSNAHKSIKSTKSNTNLHSLTSSQSSSTSSSYTSLSTASTSTSSSSLSSLPTSPSSSSTTSSPASPTRKNNITDKENVAPYKWIHCFGDCKKKYTKTPKETDTNNHTTNYTGPLCEITVTIKPESLNSSSSNSSTDSDDLHVRKKKVINISPNRVRFMRSLSPIRSDGEPRKGKESCHQQEEHPIQQIR